VSLEGWKTVAEIVQAAITSLAVLVAIGLGLGAFSRARRWVERGGGALLVPVGGEVARWSAQPLEHPVVANSVHSESPSDVVENDVQLAVVVLDVATSGGLIDASAAEVRGHCPALKITVVE
jgi:hypothetical protein